MRKIINYAICLPIIIFFTFIVLRVGGIDYLIKILLPVCLISFLVTLVIAMIRRR